MERQQSLRAARAEAEWPMSARWSPDGGYLAIGTEHACGISLPSRVTAPRVRHFRPFRRGLCIWSNGALR